MHCLGPGDGLAESVRLLMILARVWRLLGSLLRAAAQVACLWMMT